MNDRSELVRSTAEVDPELVVMLSLGPGAREALQQKLLEIAASCGPLYSRKCVPVHAGEQPAAVGDAIVVKQFNLLAEGLSAPPSSTPPFTAEEASSYGGFDSVADSDTVFDFHRCRKWRLLEEIFRAGSVPDILAVQECDHFADFFEPALRIMGYEGSFRPKTNSPCLRYGYYSDGVALFWKKSLFQPLSENSEEKPPYSPRAAYLGIRLLHKPTDRPIFVATCHLKAKKGAEMERIRHAQLDYILSVIATATSTATSGPSECPVILLGDFNTTPQDHCSDEHSSLTVIPHTQQWNGGFFSSAYPFLSTGECIDPAIWTYSTWKSRGGVEAKQLIDYIWFSKRHFELQWILDVPDIAELKSSTSKLPDMRYPSDHIALCSQLVLLSTTKWE